MYAKITVRFVVSVFFTANTICGCRGRREALAKYEHVASRQKQASNMVMKVKMAHDSPVSSKVPSKLSITSVVSLVDRACYRVLYELVKELGLYVTPWMMCQGGSTISFAPTNIFVLTVDVDRVDVLYTNLVLFSSLLDGVFGGLT